jgi:hypothetical protein
VYIFVHCKKRLEVETGVVREQLEVETGVVRGQLFFFIMLKNESGVRRKRLL